MSYVYPNHSAYNRDLIYGRGGATLPPHSRNFSTVSSATVQSSSTSYSHPTEPLLPPSGPLGEAYYGDSSATSRADFSPATSVERTWQTSHPKEGVLLKEKGAMGGMEYASGGSSGGTYARWKWTKLGLEVVIGGWAIYNAVRYFLAFMTYQSDAGQLVSLALGVGSCLSCAFLVAALVFSWFQPRLIYHGASPHSTSNVYWCLVYASVFLLFIPAAVNFALTFAWRNSDDFQLRIKYRCYVDIDLVWSRTDRLCKAKASSWGFWVVLSGLRLLVTVLAIVAYPMVLRKLRRMTSIAPGPFRSKHRLHPSDAIFPHGASHVANGHSSDDSGRRSETSLLSLGATANLGIPHLSPRTLQFSRSQSSGLTATATNSPASNPSQGYGHSQSGLYPNLSTPLSSLPEAARGAGDPDGFTSLVSQIHQETDAAIQFAHSEHTGSTNSRSTQSINVSVESSSLGSPKLQHSDLWRLEEQEEEGQACAQLETDGRPHRSIQPPYQHGSSDRRDPGSDEEDFYSSPISHNPVVGYNEFGLPYPAEEEIAMLNGYVRRMPTIESVGSREMGSSIGASSMMNRNSIAGSSIANRLSHISRPPTRNTLLSMLSHEFDGSQRGKGEEESQRDSLNVQVERLAALGALSGTSGGGSANSRPDATKPSEDTNERISEIGELQSVKVLDTCIPNSYLDVDLPNLVGKYEGGETGYLHSTGGSRSTQLTYYTATMGSDRDESLVGVKTEGTSTVPMDGPTFFKV